MWLPQAQAYHYKARVYAPQLGRFMQTDPIGYAAGSNLYAYVGADPVNATDPRGLEPAFPVDDVVVTGGRIRRVKPAYGTAGRFPFFNERAYVGVHGGDRLRTPDIVYECPAAAAVAAEAEAIRQAGIRGESGLEVRESSASINAYKGGWKFGRIVPGPIGVGRAEFDNSLDRIGNIGGSWHNHLSPQPDRYNGSDGALQQWTSEYGEPEAATFISMRIFGSSTWDIVSFSGPTSPARPGEIVDRQKPCG